MISVDSDLSPPRPRAQTLTGLDASFLYAELGNVAMHTLKIALLEPGSGRALDLRALRRRIAITAARLPPLRRRLIMVPLQLHHPRWVEVERFDLEAHFDHIDLGRGSSPASDDPTQLRQLEVLLGRFAARPLARHRPLWQLLLVTGLPGERVAVAVKIHHALADGRASAELIQLVTDDEPGAWKPPRDLGRHLPTKPPSRRVLLARALGRRLGDLLRLPMLSLHSLVRSLRVRRLRRQAGQPARLFGGPRTFFNNRLGPARAFRHLTLPLASLDMVKRHFDVSLNDVLLAIVSGAFARMRQRGTLDGPPLIASMPLAEPGIEDAKRPSRGREPDTEERPRVQGNRVGNAFISLCDHLVDPAERLAAIHETASTAKAMASCRGIDQLRRWAEYDAPWSQRWLWKLAQAIHAPPINLIVSSVAGPREHRYVGRARIDQLWSVGPLVERAGLNVTAWSYAGQISFGLLADASQWTLEQLDQLVGDMREAAEELVAQVPRELPPELDLVS